jgi:hypothetical protein
MKRFMKFISINMFFCLFFSYQIQINAEDIQKCPKPDGVIFRSFPGDIPKPLLKSLTESYGEFASPGKDFNATDVYTKNNSDLSTRRIFFVWEHKSRWIFVTERGGIYYSTPVIICDYDQKNSKISLIKEETPTPPLTVCDVASKWVNENP